uniref:Insulin-like domain-containing protein n=1 Tax=Heliothis virescens TaxID=7102 RepID=A0A2A4JIP7_HELVI
MKLTLCLLALFTVTTLVNASPLGPSLSVDNEDGDVFSYCQNAYKEVFVMFCPERARDEHVMHRVNQLAKMCCYRVCHIDEVLNEC